MPETGSNSEDSSTDNSTGVGSACTPPKPESFLTPTTTLTPIPTSPGSTAAREQPNSALSEEEQMALFEAELKEKDWGHQPC